MSRIFLSLFLALPLFAFLSAAGAQSTPREMPWSTIGSGGAHLLVEPGPLEIRVFKRDLTTSARARRELQAMLLSPDREMIEKVTIPAFTGKSGEKPSIQSATLRADVKRPGIYLLQIFFPADDHGVNIEWSIQTNAAGWVLETARGHRDERHREPIVMNDPDRPAEIAFLPRNGDFTIEAEALLPDSAPLRLLDSSGKLVSEIPVVAERRTGIREYLRSPRPDQSEASASLTVPAAKDRGTGPWRLQIPNARFFLEISGVTHWERNDLFPNQTVWSPVPDSWFPFLENRWLITPYQRTIHTEPNETGEIRFTVHNNSPRPRTFDLSLEFPDKSWNARLAEKSVSLEPQKSREISVRYTAPGRNRGQLLHIRATPRDDSGVSTYASLRIKSSKSPVGDPIDLPHVLQPFAHENRQFGYNPKYPVDNQIYFDIENRGFVLDGRTLHRQTAKGWTTTDLRQSVTQSIPPNDAQSWTGIGTKVAFDSANNVYLLASSGKTVALLRSTNHGETFTAHIIEGRENESRSWDIEQFSGHNIPDGPPAVVRLTRTNRPSDVPVARRPAQLRWRSTNDLELIVADITRNGKLAFHEPVKMTELALGSSMHSGIPSMIVSRGSKIHVVWGEATDPDAKPEEIPGVPAYVATYDRETRTAGKPVFMSFGPPANDAHNTPSITIDSKGYLHVVVGTHGRPFQYLRSLKSNDAYSGWTEAVRTSSENLRQTYVGLVCDDQDNLHLVFRLWRTGEKHLDGALWAALAHQRKPANGDWEKPQVLVAPPLANYSIYYHRLTVDQNGDLFLNYDYWPTAWFYRNDARGPVSAASGRPGTGWGRSILTSPDNGKTWKLW